MMKRGIKMKKITITLLCASMISATIFAGSDDFEKLRAYADQVTHNSKKLAEGNKDLAENVDTLVQTNKMLVDNNKQLTRSNIDLQGSQVAFGTKCFGGGVAATTAVIALVVFLFKG